MNRLSNEHITCPYCGELIELVIDCSIPEQEYIEDCEVCCHPISMIVSVSSGHASIVSKQENE